MIKLIICWSTIFGYPGDGHGGRTPTVLYGRPVSPADMGIAMRDRKLVGKWFKVTNLRTKKSAVGRVIDTGPWGMRDEKGWFNSRKPKHRARGRALFKRIGEKAYCGCGDLTPALAKSIGHDGKDRVRLELLGKRR